MKRTLFEKLGDFVLGKGFYIVLFLCVATIGISGYYLIRSVTADPAGELEPVAGNPTVELPEQQYPTPSAKPEDQGQSAAEGRQPAGASSAAAGPATQQPAQQDTPQQTQNQTPAPAQSPRAPAVYTWPVKGGILRGHSVEALAYDQTMGDWRTHSGVDIAADEGFKVLCVSDGTVEGIYQDDLMGTTVVVNHGDGLKSTYSNLAETAAVTVGQEVDTGTVLGTVGGTAIAEGSMEAHLHLEMSKDGQSVDPTAYLPE